MRIYAIRHSDGTRFDEQTFVRHIDLDHIQMIDEPCSEDDNQRGYGFWVHLMLRDRPVFIGVDYVYDMAKTKKEIEGVFKALYKAWTGVEYQGEIT